MKVSIIIPVREINDYIREAMPHLQSLDYADYEILIFPDSLSREVFDKVKIIPSGITGPAQKRNMAIKHASGDIFAFIDDDAYPRKDWLKNAVPYFFDEKVGAVGGPAVTPDNEEFLRMVSGKIYESPLVSGQYTYRYKPGKKIESDDIPSVNLIVRGSLFREMNGFDAKYYPGEDTKLCLDIKEYGKKMIYDPEIFVWHHRRKVFKEHLKQIKNYALNRGNTVREGHATSLRLSYFVPALFLTGLVTGPLLSLLYSALWYVYAAVLSVYIFCVAAYSLRLKGFNLKLMTSVGIFLTHITYGAYFILGLITKRKNYYS